MSSDNFIKCFLIFSSFTSIFTKVIGITLNLNENLLNLIRNTRQYGDKDGQATDGNTSSDNECDYLDKKYTHGSFIPPDSVCETCQCLYGLILCNNIRDCDPSQGNPMAESSTTSPSNWEEPEESNDCVDVDKRYAHGSFVESDSVCETCECLFGLILCNMDKLCNASQGDSAAQLSTASQKEMTTTPMDIYECMYLDKIYSNGDFVDINPTCETCQCIMGNILCNTFRSCHTH